MPALKYGGLVEQSGNTTVTGLGVSPGPQGGDGWQIVAILPAAELPTGASRFAIYVTGKIHNLQNIVSTALPTRGVLQVALGFDTGNVSPVQQFVLPLRTQAGALEGIPFGFSMVQFAAPAVSDPFFGATFNPAGGSQFCIWARVYTNGDPLTYNYSFDISDLTWLWWDTGRIPAGDVLVEHYNPTTPVALTTTPALLYSNLNAPGLATESWLHFHSADYAPPVGLRGTMQAPILQFGYTTDGTLAGFVAKVGTNGRWAQSHGDVNINSANPSSTPRSAMWGWWYGVQPSGTFRPALRGVERFGLGGSSATRLHRYTYVGIRLDNLLDLLVRTDTEVVGATANRYSTPAEGSAYVPLERPATGIVSQPCVMATGLVTTTARHDYECELWTNRRNLRGTTSHVVARAQIAEGCPAMAFAARGLSASAPDVQYRVRFTGGLNAAPFSLPARDISIVQFNFVRDADPDPNGPGTPGAPVVITIGREAAAVTTDLPYAPDSAVDEEFVEPERQAIRGATGYVRTWPMFIVARRRWTLTWGALPEAQARTLHDFLRANSTFRWAPPREGNVIVTTTDDPDLTQLSAQAYSVSVAVVELIWTGP
jgi:hypothetical protein